MRRRLQGSTGKVKIDEPRRTLLGLNGERRYEKEISEEAEKGFVKEAEKGETAGLVRETIGGVRSWLGMNLTWRCSSYDELLISTLPTVIP